jgi:hypothetical protein
VPAEFSRPYLRTTRTYLTDSFFTKGLMTSEGFEGLDTGAPRTFAETSHSYALREVDTQRVLTSPATITETLSSLPRAAHDDPAPRRRQREHGDPDPGQPSVRRRRQRHLDLNQALLGHLNCIPRCH